MCDFLKKLFGGNDMRIKNFRDLLALLIAVIVFPGL